MYCEDAAVVAWPWPGKSAVLPTGGRPFPEDCGGSSLNGSKVVMDDVADTPEVGGAAGKGPGVEKVSAAVVP